MGLSSTLHNRANLDWAGIELYYALSNIRRGGLVPLYTKHFNSFLFSREGLVGGGGGGGALNSPSKQEGQI